MVVPQAMRTVWLALLCLIGLATTVIVKFAVSSYDLPKALGSRIRPVMPSQGVAWRHPLALLRTPSVNFSIRCVLQLVETSNYRTDSCYPPGILTTLISIAEK